MIRGTAVVATAVATVVLIGWLVARPTGDGDAQPRIRDTTSVRVVLERGMCYGTCPVYQVEVHGDGRVLYEGRRLVADSGQRERAIEPATIRALLIAFDRARFHRTPNRYGAADCYDMTDLPDAAITLEADGASKRLDLYFGCRSLPERLADLAQAIDSLSGVVPWVVGPRPPE